MTTDADIALAGERHAEWQRRCELSLHGRRLAEQLAVLVRPDMSAVTVSASVTVRCTEVLMWVERGDVRDEPTRAPRDVVASVLGLRKTCTNPGMGTWLQMRVRWAPHAELVYEFDDLSKPTWVEQVPGVDEYDFESLVQMRNVNHVPPWWRADQDRPAL